MIDSIIEKAKRPMPRIVSRREFIHNETGKRYGAGGFPYGISREDCTMSDPYFVFQSSDGCTYGKRYASEEEARQAALDFENARSAEFKAQLEMMSPKQLKAQADYWLSR